MKESLFKPKKSVSKGPFLLNAITETPEKDLVVTLARSEDHAMMERIIMAVRTEIGLKLARKNGTEYRQAPFTYKYHPDTQSFIIKPIANILDLLKTSMGYLLSPETPEKNNTKRA